MRNYDRAIVADKLESIGIEIGMDTVDIGKCRRVLGLKYWGMIDFLTGCNKDGTSRFHLRLQGLKEYNR